jgi:hypothetical protein
MIILLIFIFLAPTPVIANSEHFYVQMINPPLETIYWTIGWAGLTGGPVKPNEIVAMSIYGKPYPPQNRGISFVSWGGFGCQTFNAYKGGITANVFEPVPGALYTVNFHSAANYEPTPDLSYVIPQNDPVYGIPLPKTDIYVKVVNAPSDVSSWYVWEVELPDGGSMVQNVSGNITDILTMNVNSVFGMMGGFLHLDGTRIPVAEGPFDYDWILARDGDVYIYDFNWVLQLATPGDSNLDNVLDMGDVVRVERKILGLEKIFNTDANRDGVTDMGDVIKIERNILGLD